MPLALPAEGGCQCGELRYRITGAPAWLTICHCLECQRQTGSAFGMSLRVRREDVEVLKGELKTWTRPADSGATVVCRFCGTCGNRIWHEPSDPAFLHIKPGTLDDPSQVAPQYESWTARKAGWVSVEGVEKSFEGQP